MKTIEVGQIVSSKAGRDQGRLFLVTKVIDEQYVEIVDGSLRKLAKPKKKKIKHLDIKNNVCETLRIKIETGKQIFDAEIRNSLESIKAPGN